MMRSRIVGWSIVGLSLAVAETQAAEAVMPAPQPFRQEIALHHPWPTGAIPSGPRLITITQNGVLAFEGTGWHRLTSEAVLSVRAPIGTTGYISLPWQDRWWQLPVAPGSVRQLVNGDEALWLLAGQREIWRLDADRTERMEAPVDQARQIALKADGTLLVAATPGLWAFRFGSDGWERLSVIDEVGRDWTAGPVLGVAIAKDGAEWIATPSGVVQRSAGKTTCYTPAEGLPLLDCHCLATGPAGELWIGTSRGAIRFDGRRWAYREGPRWLPGGFVRNLVVDARGTAWFATDAGFGCIQSSPMTLAEKADFFEGEIERYIKRTPLGYLSEVRLGAPGDRSEITYHDSDNDGLWTAMYGAGECFAYGATQQPEFRQRARQAFEALSFLQKVTQGGAHSPPKGFVARTIRPASWPDPNVGRIEEDRRTQQQHDRLWKVYEPRWPRSADGRWYWKSDTSSDELDGHYFFYAAYYDLVAESETERDRVRDVVRDLTDHLVDHDFCLVDHDGTPTRWARFGPQYLNDDPLWWVERGLNSLSILSYLAVAEYITGDSKYGDAAGSLIRDHGYGANVMNPKVQMGIGSGNQSDDEMAFMCFYNLLRYTKSALWKNNWHFAFYAAWALEQPERNPFFNFAYASVGLGESYANAYGDVSVAPWPGWLADSVETLRGLPLDRVNWPHHNSHRLDLRPLPLQQSRDLADPDRRPRGAGSDGMVLPVEERHFNHWNIDPWELDYGGDGRTLASGTVFLLPYYMGLYHGYIAKP